MFWVCLMCLSWLKGRATRQSRKRKIMNDRCWVHVCRWVFRINMPGPVRIKLVDALADTEHRLAFGTSERLQLGALVGAFSVAREGIVAAAK